MADKDFELIFYHYGTIACSNSCFVQRAIEAAGAARELTLVFARLWSVPALIRDVYPATSDGIRHGAVRIIRTAAHGFRQANA